MTYILYIFFKICQFFEDFFIFLVINCELLSIFKLYKLDLKIFLYINILYETKNYVMENKRLTAKKIALKVMVDFILYNRLGSNPTKDQVEKLLNEYRISLKEKEDSIEQTKLLIDRLDESLHGNPLYTDSHKRFREECSKILGQFDSESIEEQS